MTNTEYLRARCYCDVGAPELSYESAAAMLSAYERYYAATILVGRNQWVWTDVGEISDTNKPRTVIVSVKAQVRVAEATP